MFRGQALLGLVERRGLAGRVLKRLKPGDDLVLVDVRDGILQRLDPVACEHRGVLLGTGLGRRDDHPVVALQRLHRAATGAGRVDDQLPRGRDVIAPACELFGRHIRARQVELVLGAVKGAMAHQGDHQDIIGMRSAGNVDQRLLQGSRVASGPASVTTCAVAPPALVMRSRSAASAVKRCS